MGAERTAALALLLPFLPSLLLTATSSPSKIAPASERGAAPGEYKVVVTKMVGILPPGAEPPSPDDERKMMKQREDFAKNSDKYLRSLLPTVYGSPTPLRCKVPIDRQVVLNLTSAAGSHSSPKSPGRGQGGEHQLPSTFNGQLSRYMEASRPRLARFLLFFLIAYIIGARPTPPLLWSPVG